MYYVYKKIQCKVVVVDVSTSAMVQAVAGEWCKV